MAFEAPAIIRLWPKSADGLVHWRSLHGVIPRSGVVPRAGIVARECVMLAAGSMDETAPEAREPQNEEVGTLGRVRQDCSKLPALKFRARLERKLEGLAVDLNERRQHPGCPRIVKIGVKSKKWGR